MDLFTMEDEVCDTSNNDMDLTEVGCINNQNIKKTILDKFEPILEEATDDYDLLVQGQHKEEAKQQHENESQQLEDESLKQHEESHKQHEHSQKQHEETQKQLEHSQKQHDKSQQREQGPSCDFMDAQKLKHQELSELLYQRLVETGCRDQISDMCKQVIVHRGIENVQVGEIVREIYQKARHRIPGHVQEELQSKIREFTHLASMSDETIKNTVANANISLL